jgi:hypothetical protein
MLLYESDHSVSLTPFLTPSCRKPLRQAYAAVRGHAAACVPYAMPYATLSMSPCLWRWRCLCLGLSLSVPAAVPMLVHLCPSVCRRCCICECVCMPVSVCAAKAAKSTSVRALVRMSAKHPQHNNSLCCQCTVPRNDS